MEYNYKSKARISEFDLPCFVLTRSNAWAKIKFVIIVNSVVHDNPFSF